MSTNIYISQTNNPMTDEDSTAAPDTRTPSNVHFNESKELVENLGFTDIENEQSVELSQEEEDQFYDKVMKTTLL